MSTQKSNISKHLTGTLLILVLIILVNVICKNYFFRIDLTSEKRYTLSDDTKDILSELEDVVFVRVFLDGELNIPLEKFQKNIVELLNEFRIYSHKNLEFELSDPFEGISAQARMNIIKEFQQKGLKPTNINYTDEDGSTSEKIVVPGAMVSYQGMEIPINLLVNKMGVAYEENINNSIEALEYTLISTIKNITTKKINKIAFIEGHGEWPQIAIFDIMEELRKSYQIDIGAINGVQGRLDEYQAIVIAGAIEPFSEADKYIIDQYIMHGGKVLWLIDGVNVDFDSLAYGGTIGMPNELNLDDMFFRYGVRINKDIVQDAQCNRIPINVAFDGENPNFQPLYWIYYPLISPPDSNVITKNVSMVWTRFASSIDIIEARKNITKTVLLSSSGMSRSIETPAIIQLQEAMSPPAPEVFDKANIPIGVLLEGTFESVFKNRLAGEYFDKLQKPTLNESPATKMGIIADADIIRNDIKFVKEQASPLPLGFDRFNRQTFANSDFIVNTLDYLINDTKLLELRGREFKIRLLNRTKIRDERLKWQLINLLAPVILLILAGVVYNFNRRRKYTR